MIAVPEGHCARVGEQGDFPGFHQRTQPPEIPEFQVLRADFFVLELHGEVVPVVPAAKEHGVLERRAEPEEILPAQQRRAWRIGHPDEVATPQRGHESRPRGFDHLGEPLRFSTPVAQSIDGRARQEIDVDGLPNVSHLSAWSAR